MAAEVEIVGSKMNRTLGLPNRNNYPPSQYRNSFPSWVLPQQHRSDAYFRMKRSSATVDPPPQCALSPQDATLLGNNSHRLGKDKSYPFSPVNRGSGRNPRPMQRQPKREPQPVSQAWSNNTFENSNTSWEGDWSNASSTPPIKTEPSPTGYYNHRNTGSFQSSSEWSPGDSSASSSMMPSAYSMMPQQSPSNSSLSASSSSYYESNGFYGSGYNYGQSGYMQQAPYGVPPQQQQHQYHEPVRSFDGVSGSYNNHRNPSSCPQTLHKQPIPDYQRKQMRYPMDGVPRVQIKREPEDYNEVDGDNFTSLFTRSLTSLYSQDAENAFAEENKPFEPDVMVCNTVQGMEEPYQRLSTSSQYNVNMATDYQEGRNNFGFYENRAPNCEPPQTSVSVVELGSDGDHINAFRYDRPSFDDMHLYTCPPNDAKSQGKKRKINMPSATPESCYPGAENRKKTPRTVPSYKSESQWTPNSFMFSDIQIKQEPIDDYSTNEMDAQNCSGLPYKESSPSSNGTGGNGNKSPGQQPDHPKQPPRKRSPAATCFDRFDKKSTPTNKKVSPLSVYAKVQENVVLSVKCRRYKKRTKPITSKEEPVCPGREEMELYKQNSLTPDQAAHQVMSELLERVSLFEERSVIDGPNLTQMDAMKVRELLMQFCHRYSLDYRDFEDINSVLRPRIINDNFAKNSDRASAIRKRTSTSPVQREVEPQPVRKTSSRAERVTKKASVEEAKPAERRVLRSLPGRLDRVEQVSCEGNQESVIGRRYSTRSGNTSTQFDIIISSSTESESEAGKEAEVRKKSQRLKKKTPATVTTPARSRTSSKASNVKSTESNVKSTESNVKSTERNVKSTESNVKSTERNVKSTESNVKSIESNVKSTESNVKSTQSVQKRVCTRSRENKDVTKLVDAPDTNMNRMNLRSRRDRMFRKDSTDSTRSSSVEILHVSKNSIDEAIDAVIAQSFLDESEKSSKRTSKPSVKNKVSVKVADKSPASRKKTSRTSTSKNSATKILAKSPSSEVKVEMEDSIVFLNLPDQPKGKSKKVVSKRRTRNNAGAEVNSAGDMSDLEELEPLHNLKNSSKRLKNIKNLEMKDPVVSSCDVIVKEELSPKQLKHASRNSSLKNNSDKSLQDKDLINSKSHFSAIKKEEDHSKQQDSEFTQLGATNFSESSKALKNDKVKIDSCVRLSEDLKLHQEVASKTGRSRSLSNSIKPPKSSKRHSKKSCIDSQLIGDSDATKQNSDKSLFSYPVSSKSSKQPKDSPKASSELCLHSDESFKAIKDNRKSATTKLIAENVNLKKLSEDKKTIDSTESCDTPKLPKVKKSRKPKSQIDCKKASKLKDRSKESVASSVYNTKNMPMLQPEVKFIKDTNKDSTVDPSSILKSLKETPKKSMTGIPEPEVSSKVSPRKSMTGIPEPEVSSKVSPSKSMTGIPEPEVSSKVSPSKSMTRIPEPEVSSKLSPRKSMTGIPKPEVSSKLSPRKSMTGIPNPEVSSKLSPRKSMAGIPNPEVSSKVSPNKSMTGIPNPEVSSKVSPRKSMSGIPEPEVSSQVSCRKVDDLVAAVSSLVESEKEFKLLENDKKTIAAHSLLELGNSSQFLKVGSILTPARRSAKLEVNNPVSLVSKSSSNSTSDSMTSVHSWKSEKKNDEPEVIDLASSCSSAGPNKPKLVETPFAYYNTMSYEKPIAVNTPYTYRNSEKYEKQVAVNTPFIYRNYEKPVAVNTPYIYRNSENQEAPTSLPLRNSQRLRRIIDKRPVRVNSSSDIDKPLVVETSDTRSSSKEPHDSRLSQPANKVNSIAIPAVKDLSADSEELCVRSPSPVTNPLNCIDVKRKRLKMFSRSPSKLSLLSNCSRLSDSEPQVVLTKLPDVHVNAKDGSVSAEVVKMCEMTEEKKPSFTRIHKSKCRKSSVDKPPVLVSMKVVNYRASSPTSSLSTSPPCIDSLDDTDIPVNLSTTSSSKKTCHSAKVAPRLRSFSEDSDCGLVIDLDRRTSIEERVPSPTLQSSAIIDGMKKASVSEDPTSFFLDRPVPSTSSDSANRSAEEKEASHTLLELTRSMLPPMSTEDDWNFSSAESEERRRGRRAREVRERARDESILRTLLLETGAISPSQDRSQPGSDSSADSKDPITQEITRLLLLCETNDEDSSESISGRKFPLEIITDLNANSLITDLEADQQDIKEQIRKLKNEIVYLKCIADKKDRERTAVVCFKRYKEEILKRVMKRFAFNSNDLMQENNPSNQNFSIDTDSDDATHLHASPHRHHTAIENDLPAVTSSGHNPTVNTKATTNIDMKTENKSSTSTSTGTSTSTSKTVLQAVLSIRESVGTFGKASLSEEAVQIIQETTSTTRDPTINSSPLSMPNLSPRRNSSHCLRENVFNRHLSPPFLQSEFGASENSAFSATSSQNHCPIPLVVSERKRKSPRKVHSNRTSNSTRSPSRQSSTHHITNSYSLWSRDRVARNSYPDYQTNSTETISSTMGSSCFNRFSSNGYLLPLQPPQSNHHIKPDGRKSSKSNAYHHNTEGDRLALSYSSLMNSSSVASYTTPLVMGPSMVFTDASGAFAPTCPPKCMGCEIEDGVLLCSGCRKHWYCSPKCQNLLWPEHKNECGSASGNIYNPGPSTSYN